jgi:hypothetical protein
VRLKEGSDLVHRLRAYPLPLPASLGRGGYLHAVLVTVEARDTVPYALFRSVSS